MVIAVTWISTWTVLSISISVLVFAIVMLLCCACHEKNEKQNVHQLHVLDCSGREISAEHLEAMSNESGCFRRFSSIGLQSNVSALCSARRYCRRRSYDIIVVNNDLENADDSRIENVQLNIHCDKAAETDFESLNENCNDEYKSLESRNSFYSIYPDLMRTNSVAETLKSVISQCDVEI